MKTKAFTLIETLLVLVILGILVNVSMPSYLEARKMGQAVRVISDFKAIQNAVYAFYAENGYYPKDSYPGKLPNELVPYLSKNFKFNLNPSIKATYDWDNWVVDGKPKHPYTGILYGISVTTTDKALINKIQSLYKGPFKWSINQNYTFILEPYVK